MTPALAQDKSNHGLISPEVGTVPIAGVLGGGRRLEASSYLSAGFKVRRAIESKAGQFTLLGKLAEIRQPSRLKAILVRSEHGIPAISATQAFHTLPTPRKWVAPSRTPDLAQRTVKPGWILVTRSGTVGDAIIAYSAHTGIVVSDDLIRVEVENPELRSYVYAFLRTWLGRAMMRSSHYGNVIKHLEVAHLEQIPMPMVDKLLDEIHDSVSEAFEARDSAHQLDSFARDKFAEAMHDLPNLSDEVGYAIPTSQIFSGRRRLEAQAHSPASRFLSQVYTRNSKSVVALGSVADAFLPARFKRIFGNSGTPYLDSEPIFKLNPEVSKFLTPASTKVNLMLAQLPSRTRMVATSALRTNIRAERADDHRKRIPRGKSSYRAHHAHHSESWDARVRPGDYLQTVLSHPTLGQPSTRL